MSASATPPNPPVPTDIVDLSRVPQKLRPTADWLLAHWPGRIALRTAAASIRVELFDRSMTIAAQVFTSVFPVLIMLSLLIGKDDSEAIADAVDLPDGTRAVLESALDTTGDSAFGIVGALVVVISATSLSRALIRAFAKIWSLPRPKSSLASAWRWVAAVFALAVSLTVARAFATLAADLTAHWLWALFSVLGDMAIAVLLPWFLLRGHVPVKMLAPGGLIFGVVMLMVRPVSGVYLPRALSESSDRYGVIGVAFTYLSWLYIVAFCFILAAMIGQVVASDDARLGRWIRGRSTVTRDAEGDQTHDDD